MIVYIEHQFQWVIIDLWNWHADTLMFYRQQHERDIDYIKEAVASWKYHKQEFFFRNFKFT
jgi:hypothetical protein